MLVFIKFEFMKENVLATRLKDHKITTKMINEICVEERNVFVAARTFFEREFPVLSHALENSDIGWEIVVFSSGLVMITYEDNDRNPKVIDFFIDKKIVELALSCK